MKKAIEKENIQITNALGLDSKSRVGEVGKEKSVDVDSYWEWFSCRNEW